MREYSLKFTKLSKYSPSLVANSCARMIKFISEVSNVVVKECRTSNLVKEMEIFWFMTYTKQIEGEKLKEKRVTESKRAQFEGGFSNSRSSDGSGHFQQ